MNSKKLLPVVIFLITVILGVASIIVSFKFQKKRPEIYGQIPGCEDWDQDCIRKHCNKNPGEWCCEGGNGDKYTYETTNVRVYCQDPGGPPLPMANVTLSINKFDALKTGCNNCHDDWEWGCYRCEYHSHGLSTDENGATLLRYPVKFNNSEWKQYLQKLQITQLPDTFTFTLDSPVTLADGRRIEAGTYDVSSDQLTGPEYPSCGACSRWYQGDCGKCPERSYECNTPSCQGNAYNCCNISGINGAFEFRYLNCFPQASPSPQSFVCTDLTRSPTVDLDIGDTISFTCSHTTENVQFDHYEFRWSLDSGTTWTNLDTNNTSGTSGPHTIQTEGNYIAQCRACAKEGHNPNDSSQCTNWGQAEGWEEGPSRP